MARFQTPEPSADVRIDEQGMAVQTSFLPYALAVFAVSLPVFAWVGGHAANAAWMGVSFGAFAVACGAFYAGLNWLKSPAAADVKLRARVHLLGGLVWACAIAQVAIFADGAGPMRETLLLLSLAAAMTSVIFASPWLPSLLVVAPAALTGPVVLLFLRPSDTPVARLALAAAALSLALGLMVNRMFRRQFGLAIERETLMAERAEQAEAARKLARSKSDLVSTLSDEIRNGLTGVAHVLAAAAGPGARGASRQQLAAAHEAVADLLAVLDTTVDSEAAEAGRLAVQPCPVDLAAVARDLVDAQRPTARAKGLQLAFKVEPDLADAQGAAVADPGRLRQVLAALIGNAVKFTARGRVEVSLDLAPGGRIAVVVSDTGPGLSEDELALAFQPFQRIARISAGAPGAGLGLPLAAQLARLMGGEVTAESAPGLGSRFILVLPFDPTAVVQAEAPAPEPVLRRLRILVVERDSLTAAMLRACLEQLGHQVVQAADGARAVELARVCDFDLSVLAAAEAGRALPALRALPGAAGATPAIVLVGGQPEDARDALAAGADALLRKPVAVPAAARAIAQALTERAAPSRAVA